MKKRKDGRIQKAVFIEVDGKRKRKYFYGHSLAEVTQKMLDYRADAEQAKSESMLFVDVADAWYQEHSIGVEYNTASGYKAPLEDLKKRFQDYTIQSITTAEMQTFIAEYAATGKARHTVELRIITMRQIYKYAIKHNWALFNPADNIDIPAICKTAIRLPPSSEDEERIKTAARKDDLSWMELYSVIELYTGMRRSEALPLRHSDFDLVMKRIDIRRTCIFKGNQPFLRDERGKSDAAIRSVPITNELYEILKDIIDPSRDDYLFPGKGKNGLLTKGQFTHGWKRLGLDSTPHQYRHRFATDLHAAKVEPQTARLILGVSSERVRDIYTHIDAAEIEDAKTALDQLNTKRKTSKNIQNDVIDITKCVKPKRIRVKASPANR